MTKIDPSIFRAYDIRGIVETNLTPEVVHEIGRAIGSEAQKRGERVIIVARDGRLSSPKLSEVLCDGIQKTGCNVIDIGAVPTPLLYYATHILEGNSGVMITGSHNPSNYNGLKIILGGETLADQSIYALYERIQDNKFEEGIGQIWRTDIVDRYIDRICSEVKLAKPLKIVIDCGNGIGGLIAGTLFRKLGCDVTELFCEVDGTFPNHHPDPSVPSNLKDLIKAVKEQHADVGLAFDGDADRLGVVTNEGNVIYPDRQLLLFAVDVLSRHTGAEIIYDVKCTSHLRRTIMEHHGKPTMWKTGHSFMKAKMKESGALLGGEMSGHIFFKERWYGFDDGLYAGVRLLEILSKHEETSDEVFKSFADSVSTPELKIEVDEAEKFELIKKFVEHANFEHALLNTIDGLRVDFDHGWGLLRASNTTPNLILRFEADDAAALKNIQELFRKELLKTKPDFDLPF